MKTTPLFSLSLIAVFAAACASQADRAPAPRAEEDNRGMAQSGDANANANRSAGGAADADKDQAGMKAGTVPGLAIVGVFIESPLAAACGITLPPAAFFEFDSANLDVASNSSLQEVATCLSTGPLAGRKVELVGHTDPRGDDEYNRQLGRSRAQSVQEFLQKKGVSEANLVTRSMGEARAVEGDPEVWPVERRVDIRLLPE